MINSKAKTGFTQYKPIKWGINLFVLVDSSNGYTQDFIIRWFQVQNDQLVYLNRSKEPRIVMDLRLCTVECTFGTFRRRYCFELVSPTKSYMLAADSDRTRLAWTRAIKSIALVKQPGKNDSEEWRRCHSVVPATGAPDDLKELIIEIKPPCNDDWERESSTGSMDHPSSSPSKVFMWHVCVMTDLERKRTVTPSVKTTSSLSSSLTYFSYSEDDWEREYSTGIMDHPSCSPSKDSFLDKYILGKELGKGGFGTVTAGICKADGREVAIKKVLKQTPMKYITFAGEAERYPAEVALMHLVCQSPRSEHIIEMLEWYDDPASYTLVLEKPSPCMDLSKYLLQGPLSEHVAQIIMVQVVRALCHCSARDVFHSDIKTENILVNPDNLKVKLIDFGCGDLIQMTPYNTFAGTWYNIPPEFLLYSEYHWGPATVWSLGILLYVVLCDDLPFDCLEKVCMGYLGFRRYLSLACCQLIRCCLARRPDNRLRLSEILDHEWFQSEEHQQLV